MEKEASESDESRESWPSLGSEFRGEVWVRRENKRLGWRRCLAVIQDTLKIWDQKRVIHELSLNEWLSVEDKKPNPQRPAHRLIMGGYDIGFFGADAKEKRDAWLSELVLAGAETAPEIAALAVLPLPQEEERLVQALEALERSFKHEGIAGEAIKEAARPFFSYPPDCLLPRGASTRCLAAACRTRPQEAAAVAAAVAYMCIENDDCVSALRNLLPFEPALRRRDGRPLAVIASDASRDFEVRTDAAHILATCVPETLTRLPLGDLMVEPLIRAMAERCPDVLRRELPAQKIVDAICNGIDLIPSLARLLTEFYPSKHEDPEVDLDVPEEQPLEREESYELTFESGGQNGLGLELTAGQQRSLISPAVHRTNPFTRASGVAPKDELIAVNGRRLEYEGPVRAAMIAACETVRDAPWPKTLKFARKRGLAAKPRDCRELIRELLNAGLLEEILKRPSPESCAVLSALAPFRATSAGLQFAISQDCPEGIAAYAALTRPPKSDPRPPREEWWSDPTAQYETLHFTVEGPLGCTIGFRGFCCVENSHDPLRKGDIIISANGRRPAKDIQIFFASLTFPLDLDILRLIIPEPITQEKEELYGDHERVVKACVDKYLYETPEIAARAIEGAARLAPEMTRNHVMAISTATAVALTPGLVQRLSSWQPQDGLSREEAAALVPLAETVISDALPVNPTATTGSALSRLVELQTEAALDALTTIGLPVDTTAITPLLGGHKGPEVAAAAVRYLLSTKQHVDASVVWLIRGEEPRGPFSIDDIRPDALKLLPYTNDKKAVALLRPNDTDTLRAVALTRWEHLTDECLDSLDTDMLALLAPRTQRIAPFASKLLKARAVEALEYIELKDSPEFRECCRSCMGTASEAAFLRASRNLGAAVASAAPEALAKSGAVDLMRQAHIVPAFWEVVPSEVLPELLVSPAIDAAALALARRPMAIDPTPLFYHDSAPVARALTALLPFVDEKRLRRPIARLLGKFPEEFLDVCGPLSLLCKGLKPSGEVPVRDAPLALLWRAEVELKDEHLLELERRLDGPCGAMALAVLATNKPDAEFARDVAQRALAQPHDVIGFEAAARMSRYLDLDVSEAVRFATRPALVWLCEALVRRPQPVDLEQQLQNQPAMEGPLMAALAATATQIPDVTPKTPEGAALLHFLKLRLGMFDDGPRATGHISASSILIKDKV